jgi:tRNA(fMet)-specific endonuclease VapC
LILDTNAVSALADGDRKLLVVVRHVKAFCLPVIVLGEFRFGIERSRYRDKYSEWLERLIDVSSVLDVDRDTAKVYAVIREQLRVQGQPIPSNDTWIAALALQHRLTVVTRDAHFTSIVGLTSITW